MVRKSGRRSMVQEKGGLSVYAAVQICSKDAAHVVEVKLAATAVRSGHLAKAVGSIGSPA